MLERILLTIALLLSILLARFGIRWWQRRIQLHNRNPVAAATLQELGLGEGTAIIAFSTPECAQCHLMQKPALDELQRQQPGVQVRHINAAEYPDVASAFGVLTVPTTVVLDARHRPMATNNGHAPTARLRQQICSTRTAPKTPALVPQN